MSKPINKMNVKELKAQCKLLKIKGYSKLKKAQLLSKIQEKMNPVVIKQETPKTSSKLIIDTSDACLLNIKVIQKQTTRVLHRHKIGQSVFNFNEEQKQKTPPLPPNLSNSPMTPVASPIEEQEDEVLSDLDEFIVD